MRLRNLLNKKHRDRYRMILFKELLSIYQPRCPTIPIFVFGLQRSGTTMIINVFEMNKHIKVYNENPDNKVFRNSLIKDLNILHQSVDECKRSFVAYKTISDSHRIMDFLREFKTCKALWVYRSYQDVANSTDRKFPHADRAIRIVCTGGTGGGWLQEGVSQESQQILRDIYSPHLTRYECLCLVWWARNRLVFEHDLGSLHNLLLVDYDRLVQNKTDEFNTISQFIGLEFGQQHMSGVHAGSVGKNQAPDINKDVKRLCEELTNALEQTFLSNRALHALQASRA